MIPYLRLFQIAANEKVAIAARNGAKVIVLTSPTGSGKSTMGCDLVRRAVAKERRVLFIVHRRRLVEQFSERLFDFEIDHGVLMAGRPKRDECRVQVASRDTLLSREFELPPADLVIVDEGRHAAAPECRKLLAPYDGKHIVLLDATPVMPDGRGLGPWAEALVVAEKVTALIRDGFLVPVKCFAPDRAEQKHKRGVAGNLVESRQQYAEGMPTVLFCSRVQHSRDAVAEFNMAGIAAVHVDAETDDDERDRAFHGLEDGSVKVVSNVGIIKEGVDIPCLGCAQIYMEMGSRTAFLQACGRIMRPFPGKTHAVLIDHSGAVFRHGFPDEDSEWTLTGNVDANFQKAHDDGLTEKALYCKKCELVYHGQPQCPQCGGYPSKPPKSIFAPDSVDASNELLTAVDRDVDRSGYVREAQIQHWFRCLATAAKRQSTFGMAAQVYKRKYGKWPGDDFPCMPNNRQWKARVEDVYPQFGKKARA